MITMEYPQYNDPFLIIWRAGTPDDPYIDKTDTLKIINNQIVLSEIPDEFNHVTISGYTEVYNTPPTSTQFVVNYQNGIVTFNSSEEGKTVTATYKGRGLIQYPAERIYVHSDNPDITQNIQQMIDNGKTAIDAYAGISGAIDTANTVKGQLETDINTGNTLHSNLTNDISIGNTLHTNLTSDINTGNILKSNLDSDISTGNSLHNTLTSDINTGNTLHTNLTDDISTGNTLKSNLDISITNATDINNTLNGSIASGTNKIQEMDAKITEANTAINNINTTNTNFSVWENYDNTKTYVPMNKVTYQGSSYVCIQQSTGNLPTNTAYWQLIAQKGQDGIGTGDMNKSIYDTNNNGIVDNSEKIGGKSLNELVQNLGNTPSIQSGVDASKPTAGTVGRLYIATDTQVIYRDTGTAWQKVGAVKWGDIEGKPASFTPSAHKSTHASGGSDVLTPADIGAVSKSGDTMTGELSVPSIVIGDTLGNQWRFKIDGTNNIAYFEEV